MECAIHHVVLIRLRDRSLSHGYEVDPDVEGKAKRGQPITRYANKPSAGSLRFQHYLLRHKAAIRSMKLAIPLKSCIAACE